MLLNDEVCAELVVQLPADEVVRLTPLMQARARREGHAARAVPVRRVRVRVRIRARARVRVSVSVRVRVRG